MQLLFILGLLIGPSQPGIFTKSLFFNFNSSALNRPNKIVKISTFNVSYLAVKSTAAVKHFYYTILRNANYENHNTNSRSTQG